MSDYKRHKEILGVMNIHYLECGNGFMGLYIYIEAHHIVHLLCLSYAFYSSIKLF